MKKFLAKLCVGILISTQSLSGNASAKINYSRGDIVTEKRGQAVYNTVGGI